MIFIIKQKTRIGSGSLRVVALGMVLAVLSGCVSPGQIEKPVLTPTVVKSDPVVLEFAEKAVAEHRYDDAQKILQRIFIGDPKNVRAHLLLAEVILATGSPQDALRRFEQMAENENIKARALQGKGLALFRIRKDEEGRKALEQAVKADATLWRSWNALGYYYDMAGNWKNASEAYDNALKGNPKSATIYNNRGYSRLLQNRLDESISDLRTAVSFDPQLRISRLNLQLALAWNGQYARAMLGVPHKERGNALNNIGYVALLRADFPAAESFFLRALETDAAYNVTAHQNLSYLKNLKEVQKSEANGDRKRKN